MEQLTVEAARSLIMEEDIPAMSATPAEDSSDARRGAFMAPGSPQASTDETPAESTAALTADDAVAIAYDENSVGLGVDIVEIERMKRILTRTPSFAARVFSPEERAYCDRMASPATHYALRFAAKEAVVKALGTGFSEGIGARDIEVERAKNGRPIAKLSGRALEVAEEQGVRELSISLSYTHTDAVACAMAVTEASVRASERRKDPMEELARQFKEVRGMLDEL